MSEVNREATQNRTISPLVLGVAASAMTSGGAVASPYGSGVGASRFVQTSGYREVSISRTAPNLAINFENAIQEVDPSMVASEVLSALQDRFGLKVAQLAQVTHVSRPTIYGWLDGGDVLRGQNVGRLHELMAAVAECDHEGVDSKSIGRLLRRPIYKGFSMLDLLSEPKLDLITLRKAYTALKEEALISYRQMERMRSKRSNVARRAASNETASDLDQLSS